MAELIEQGRISEIKEAMGNSMTAGSQTFEEALIQLIISGKVTRDDALANSDSPTNLLWLLENRAQPPAARQQEPASFNSDTTANDPRGAESAGATADGAPPKGPAKTEGASFSEFLLNI
jgi:twitching motility protein PilU